MNSKLHNRTLFVAALSVYFGLLIVGAPPQVLAQSIVSNNKETRIKIADCYDKASEEIQDLIDSDFVSYPILALLDDLKKLSQIDKYLKDERFEIKFLFRRTENVDFVSREKEFGGGNRWIFTAAEEPAYILEKEFDETIKNEFYSYDEQLKGNYKRTKIHFLSENGELKVQITSWQQSKDDAQKLADFYNKAFSIGFCSSYVKEPEKLIYQNTKASFENNQVFIVTRLPRAGLDSLLKADEKAN